MYAVSPVRNVYGALQGVRGLLARRRHFSALEDFNRVYGSASAPQIGEYGQELVQESGKPDLFACLLDRSGRTISVSIEVKAFAEKFVLDGTLWRDNQREWMNKTTFGWGYWIFLWGIPEELPRSGLRKRQKEQMQAWLVPGMIWERKAEVYYQEAKQYTIHMDIEGKRVRTALKDSGLTLSSLFAPYAMVWDRDVWWPHENHPLRIMLEEEVPLGAACAMVGDDDAMYAFPPKIDTITAIKHPDIEDCDKVVLPVA